MRAIVLGSLGSTAAAPELELSASSSPSPMAEASSGSTRMWGKVTEQKAEVYVKLPCAERLR